MDDWISKESELKTLDISQDQQCFTRYLVPSLSFSASESQIEMYYSPRVYYKISTKLVFLR